MSPYKFKEELKAMPLAACFTAPFQQTPHSSHLRDTPHSTTACATIQDNLLQLPSAPPCFQLIQRGIQRSGGDWFPSASVGRRMSLDLAPPQKHRTGTGQGESVVTREGLWGQEAKLFFLPECCTAQAPTGGSDAPGALQMVNSRVSALHKRASPSCTA